MKKDLISDEARALKFYCLSRIKSDFLRGISSTREVNQKLKSSTFKWTTKPKIQTQRGAEVWGRHGPPHKPL